MIRSSLLNKSWILSLGRRPRARGVHAADAPPAPLTPTATRPRAARAKPASRCARAATNAPAPTRGVAQARAGSCPNDRHRALYPLSSVPTPTLGNLVVVPRPAHRSRQHLAVAVPVASRGSRSIFRAQASLQVRCRTTSSACRKRTRRRRPAHAPAALSEEEARLRAATDARGRLLRRVRARWRPGSRARRLEQARGTWVTRPMPPPREPPRAPTCCASSHRSGRRAVADPAR